MKVNKRILAATACLFTILIFTFCRWRFPRKEPSQTIPIKVIHGLPIIDVNIQGHVLQLILDLGAHFSGLSKEAIEKVQLIKELKTTNSMDIFGNKFVHRVFSASKILMGNYLLPYLEFNELNDFNNDFGDSTPKTLIYGHIGREPFFDKVLFIDRKNQFCVVEKASFNKKIDLEKYHPGKWIEADFTLDKGLGIRLNLIVDSKEEKELILDTGSNFSIIDKNSLFKKTFSINNEKEEVFLKLPNETCLGMFSFYLLDSSNAGLQGILGFDFFDHYMICFDFLNKKVFLKKYE